MSEYEVIGGGLNLKGHKKKKKKKSKKSRQLDMERQDVREAVSEAIDESSVEAPELTEAERKHKEAQMELEERRLRDKAMLTHKQKVQKFNQYLDKLSEHYDIPKVSWTK